MSDVDELKELALLAREEGDEDLELAALEKLDSLTSSQKQNDRSLVGEALGLGETVLSVATGTIAEPIAGLSGLANLPLKGAEAGNVVEDVKEALTFQPRTNEGQANMQAIGKALQPLSEILQRAEQASGDLGFDISGPIGGALASTLPTAALELLGLAVPKSISKIPQSKSNKLSSKATQLADEASDLQKSIQADTPDNISDVAQTVSRGTAEDIAEIADIDDEFIKSLDEINIDEEPLTSFASRNPQFRAIEQGLSAIPGSQLDAQAKAFLGAVSKKADQMIERFGGSLDKADVSQRFRQESLKTVDQLSIEADRLYQSMDDVIPRNLEIEARNTVDFILSKANDLGGSDKLPGFMRKILKDLNPDSSIKTDLVSFKTVKKPVRSVTFELLSQRRREVGQALNKKTGPFKDSEKGLLKAVYSKLRADQDIVAESQGLLDTSKAADGLIVQRKLLEDNLKQLLGKDLRGSIMPAASQKIKKLGKGEIQQFDEFIDSIPDQFRQEVVVSSLNDIFKGSGVNQQAMNVTQFSKFMDELSRQHILKRKLYNQLPEGAKSDLDNLHKIAKGISIAQQDKIKTGIVTSLFDEQVGLLRKLMGKGASGALNFAVSATTGSAAGSVVSEFLSQSVPRSNTVSHMLASPQFKNIIVNSVREGVVQGGRISKKLQKSEKLFEKSKTYERWANSLESSDKARLASVGLISYLFDEQSSEEEINDLELNRKHP